MADERRVKTGISFSGKDYALVPDRIKLFREENPRGSIDTNPTYNEDGSVTFKAIVIKDLADEFSARASGTARYSAKEILEKKAFEKLETISIGRALSILGYLNNGEVASTEELDEFYKTKADADKEKAITAALESFAKAKNLEQLRNAFIGSKLMQEPTIVAAKDARKAELEKAAAPEKDKTDATEIPGADN